MSTRMPWFRALAITLALSAAACSDDDPTDAVAENATTEEPASTDAVAVTAVDFSFEGLPAEVDAGTTLTVRNESAAELHELVALRLPDEESRSVEQLLALPEAELEALFASPPALVVVAPPGEDGFVALGDGTLTDPGRYAVLCFIPTGADPQAYLDQLEANPEAPPQVDGGPPHFIAGMFSELTVT